MNRFWGGVLFVLVLTFLAPRHGEAHELAWQVSSRRDLPFAAAGLVLVGTGHALADRVAPVGTVLHDQRHVFPLDRGFILPYSASWDHFSDLGLGILALAPLGTRLLADPSTSRNDLATLGILELETLSFTAGIVYLTKALVRRPRPYAYRSDTPAEMLQSPDSRVSFFSGHAAVSFAAAELQRQFVNSAGGPLWLAWSGYAVATATGVSRVLAGVHFPTDVAVGAAAGVLCARGVLALHKRGRERTGDVYLTPVMFGFVVVF